MDHAAALELIDAAADKSGLLWLRPAGAQRDQPMWFVWHDGRGYAMTGGLEQPAPVDMATEAVVVVRAKDTTARVLAFAVETTPVPAGSQEWEAVVPALVAARLNLPDGAEAPQRWARECTLWRLSPTGRIVESAADPSTASHADTPPPTPARTRVPRPLHLRGRPSRNRGGR
jgi:hypothetical protein